MATTVIPNIDAPMKQDLDVAALYEWVRDWFQSAQGDSDKSGDMESACFYEGQCNVLENMFNFMCSEIDPDFEARKIA